MFDDKYYNFENIQLQISDQKMRKEFETICKKNRGYSTGNSWNNIIKYFQFEEFYKTEIAMWRANPIYRGLPLREWLFQNREKYIGKGYGKLTQEEIMRGFRISGIHIGNSYHTPFAIKQFCLDYNIKKIYDPTGGWGHRLLGALSIDNVEYFYNDINVITTENCRKIADFLGLTSRVKFTSNDSAKFVPEYNHEAVFTCPPYHDVEKYTDIGAENLPYDEFLNWWKNTIICSTKYESCKYFGYVINDTFATDMNKVVENCGFKLIATHDIQKMVSHFNKGTKKCHEHVFIFQKQTVV